jgi:hypothetical protein
MERPEMRIETLWLSLRKAHPKLTRNDLLGTEDRAGPACFITPAEWDAFDRIAWNADPWDEAAGAIDAEIGVVLPMPRTERSDWQLGIARLVEVTGWTLETIGGLYLSQWATMLRLGGKPEHPVVEPKRGEGMTEREMDATVFGPRRAFWRAIPAADSRQTPGVPAPPEAHPADGP